MIIPAMDILNGQVVRLLKGDYARVKVYSDHPVDVFRQWALEGAQQFHLVDLDGAASTKKRQLSVIGEILDQASVPVQVGGGIRSERDVEELFNAGASRVVLGSLAITQPETVKSWLGRYGADRIVVALDIVIEGGKKWVAVNGWKEKTAITLESVMDEYSSSNIRNVLCTDIDRDGTLQGSHVGLYRTLSREFPDIAWQASGGVSSLEDISAIRAGGAEGAIIGRALLEERFTVREAITCWQNG